MSTEEKRRASLTSLSDTRKKKIRPLTNILLCQVDGGDAAIPFADDPPISTKSSVRLAPSAYESSEVISNPHLTSAIEVDSATLIDIPPQSPTARTSPSHASYSENVLPTKCKLNDVSSEHEEKELSKNMETVVQLDETVVKGVSPPPLDPTGTTVEPIAEEPTPTYEPVVNHVQPPSPPRQRLPKFISATDQLRLESQLSTNQISNSTLPLSNGEKRLSNIECSEKRRQTRFVTKKGQCNVKHGNVEGKYRYFSDLFTTLVDLKWRWNLLIFCSCYVLSWFFFACIWFSIALIHNDIQPLMPSIPQRNYQDYPAFENVSFAECQTSIDQFNKG